MNCYSLPLLHLGTTLQPSPSSLPSPPPPWEFNFLSGGRSGEEDDKLPKTFALGQHRRLRRRLERELKPSKINTLFRQEAIPLLLLRVGPPATLLSLPIPIYFPRTNSHCYRAASTPPFSKKKNFLLSPLHISFLLLCEELACPSLLLQYCVYTHNTNNDEAATPVCR